MKEKRKKKKGKRVIGAEKDIDAQKIKKFKTDDATSEKVPTEICPGCGNAGWFYAKPNNFAHDFTHCWLVGHPNRSTASKVL